MVEQSRKDKWTYASANSVTARGDLTGTYWPGTKVALKQGTLKFFVVVAVTYAAPNTTITLDGMGIYSLIDAPITAHIDTTSHVPKGFPPENKEFSGYDVVVYQESGVIYAKNGRTHAVVDFGQIDGTVNTRVLRAAINACPVDGSMFIDSGTYDGLIADQLCSASDEEGYLHYYAVLPVTKNMHIQGAGIGSTILILGANQHSAEHPALIMYVYSPPVNGELQDGYTSFSLEDITFDGNKANNTPANYDGAGLFLDGSMRYNGIFRNIEFRNSANSGCYFGYHGNGYANHCYYENLISHDNAGAGICFDTVRDSVAVQLISVDDDASLITSGIGAYFMSSATQHEGWNDDLSVYGLNVHGSLLYLHALRNVKFSDVAADSSTAASATAMKLYECEDIDINNPTIRSGPEQYHHGIDADDSRDVRVNGGLIDANMCIVTYAASTIFVTGTTLRSIFEVGYIAGASRLEMLACLLEPTAGQYLLSVMDTSVVRALACSSALLAAYYKETTASFTQTGCLGMGDSGPAPLYSTVFRVGLGPDRTTYPTYTASLSTYEGLVVNGYWASPVEEPYRYRRFIDIVALGYAADLEGGSVMRFLTNPATSCVAVEAARFDRDGRLGVGEPAPTSRVTIAGDLAIADGMTEPDTANGYAKIYVDVVDGDMKAKFGDGVVQTIVPKVPTDFAVLGGVAGGQKLCGGTEVDEELTLCGTSDASKGQVTVDADLECTGDLQTDIKASIKGYCDTLYAASGTGVTNGDSHDHSGGDGAQIDHGGLSGVGDDDHSIYPNLGGRSGGQTLYGGTGAGDDIEIQSTSHATKGSIKIKGGNVVLCDSRMRVFDSGGVAIGATGTDPGTDNLYVVGDVNCASVTDHTPGYQGDALAELKTVATDVHGKINHKTLPAFARAKFTDPKTGMEIEGRNVGNMVSILTKAVQQLTEKLEAAEKKITELEAKLTYSQG